MIKIKKILASNRTFFLLVFFISNLFLSVSFAGGVSGGGGNVIDPTLPEGPQDSEIIERMIKRTTLDLKTYVQNKKNHFENGQMNSDDFNLYKPLFYNSTPIDIIIQKIKVKVQEHRPCYDSSKTPVDGSIHSESSDSICLSALRISKKVHIQDVPAQSLALMMHEYSEVIGMNEEFAVTLQKRTLEDLQ